MVGQLEQDVVLRQEHQAGETLFVDWAGTTMPIHDPRGGPVQQAHQFVAVLGAGSYAYAEATADEQLARKGAIDSLESLGFLSVFKAYRQIVSVPEDNDDREVRISFSR